MIDERESLSPILLADEVQVLMNDINIAETFYILAQERGSEKAEYFLNVVLPTLPIVNISNALYDVIQAARIKARYPISYADCFAVATALKEEATILTEDTEFNHVEKVVRIEWL